ncbi:MAG: tyrosine-type recombinase/integrase [Flavobacteriaceae bacterium]
MNSIISLHHQYSNYCLTFKGHSTNTIRGEFYNIKQFVETLQLDNIHQINKSLVENYIMEKRAKKNWKPTTTRNNIQALQSFLEYCVKEGYINQNPIRQIPMPKLHKKLPKALEREDAMRLIDWTYVAYFRYEFNRIRCRAIIATFLFTGVRKSELLDLKLTDVRIRDKVLRVECGKGSKDRLIPLNENLISILKEYLRAREKNKKTTPYFFASLRRDNRLGYMTIRRIFDRLKSELSLSVYPHKLRHTFATLMLEGNCDLYALSKMLGHSDLKTTTIYLAITTRHLKNQIDKHPLGFKEVLPHQRFPSEPVLKQKGNQWLC